jgi:transcriptional regulator with XRE-family HTH domain
MPGVRLFDHDLARARRSEGWTLRAIADSFGVSHVAVWRVVHDVPLPRRRKHAP